MTTNSERPDEKKTETPEVEAASTETTASEETAAEAKAPSEETEETVVSSESTVAETPAAEAETTETPTPVEEATPEVAKESDTAAETAAEVVMESSSDGETTAAAAASSTDESDDATDAAATAEQTAAVEADDRLKTKLKSGQRIEVTLAQVNEKESLLDFGGTAEGTIATSELKNAEGEMRVNVGDKFTAIVRKVAEPVEFTVGRGKGGDTLRMRELQSAHEGNIPIQGKIKSTNKGGFEVDLGGVRAFCPFSQIDIIYCEQPEDHVGNEYTFEIIAFERGGRNIVLSRRRLLEEAAKEAATKTREDLSVGEAREGTVRRLQPYGAFVDIGGIDGLVHVSEISRGHVADPRDVLKVGQKVQVKVIGIDDLGGKRERISLSMKELERDPWEGADQKWVAGSIVKGRVVRLTDFGAFVELAPGIDGLVHISEISADRIGHPSEVLAPDQEVDARILQVDGDSRRISLSLRPEGEARVPRPGGGGGRGRGPRPEREPESYTFEAEPDENKEPDVDVENLEYDDALELLKKKFNQ